MILQKQMKISVVLPDAPGKVETFAGEEVRKYLQKMFGQVIFTEDTGNADVIFIIGGPVRNRLTKDIISEEAFAQKVPGPEGLYYQIADNTVLLAGSDANGTLYAVYEFLEKELGCCFGAFPLPQVPAGEIVPTYETLTLADTVRYKPAADLPYRMAAVQFGGSGGDADLELAVPFFDYLAKNRYNRVQTWVGVYKQMVQLGMPAELEKRGIRLTVGMHEVLNSFLPFEGNEDFPTPYGKEHPDFFRVMVDGRRQTSEGRKHWGQWYLCSRNEACIEEMAKNINEFLEKNPVVDTIHLCPNDGVYRQCQCGHCVKHTKMENYLYFLDEVAKRLKEANAERKVDAVVYLDLWECPKGMKLSDNVELEISTWTKRGLRHIGSPDGSCLLKSHIAKTMHDFLQTGSPVVLYEYYMGNYDNNQAVMPAADEIQSICRYYRQHGFGGSGTQMECFNLWNNILNFYCFARTAYDNDLSLEDNIRAISAMFGQGGEQIKEIFRIYEQTLDGQVSIDQTGKFFASHVDAPVIYDLFEKALEQTTEPVFRNNIRMLRMAFRYTMLLHRTDEEAEEEKGVMASFFDSYEVNNPGFGIAIVANRRAERLPDDKWYQFET